MTCPTLCRFSGKELNITSLSESWRGYIGYVPGTSWDVPRGPRHVDKSDPSHV